MIHLPNNCRCSKISVYPKDWRSCGNKSLLLKWRIQYYFYDDNLNQKKLVVIKAGVNKYKTISEKRNAIKILIDSELQLLKNDGYNPIKKAFIKSKIQDYELCPNTNLITALNYSKDKMVCADQTKKDLKWIINGIDKGSKLLNFNTSIGDFKRRHLKIILNSLNLSDNTYNTYLKYLSILFVELVEMEAMETNFIRDIKKKRVKLKQRNILNMDERKKVNTHLKKNFYEFWRFTIIFFHSGGREVELLSLKAQDVDLENQTYKVVIKKGKEIRMVHRIIKDMAVYLWSEILKEANDDDYIFSVGLIPGPKKIHRDQISRRWKTHVKDKLNITADFYSLKHLNLDETTSLLSLKDAAAMASHTSTKMVEKHYAVGEKDRQMERLKKLGNSFA